MMARTLLCAIVLVAASSHAFVEVTNSGPRAVPGSYVIQFARGARKAFEDFKATSLAKPREDLATVEFGNFMAVVAQLDDSELGKMQNMDGVMRIEPNLYSHIQGEQTGVEAWGIDRLDQVKGTNQIYRWRDDAAGAGVEVHVHDTGIDVAHPEFEGRAHHLKDCTWFPGECSDEDSGDVNGHGTHCAGSVGSKTYGIAKNVTLYSVKVCTNFGTCSNGGILAGFEVTATRDTTAQRIISFSIGGGFSDVMNDAVNELHALGIVVVVAGGNGYSDSCLFSPSSAENAVSVGASTLTDDRAVFSNTGPCIDIWGPGLDVLSAAPGGGTAIMSGTSMATPHVAGVAALIASRPGQEWTSQSIVDTLYAEGSAGVLNLADHPDTINLLAFTSPDGANSDAGGANPDFSMI